MIKLIPKPQTLEMPQGTLKPLVMHDLDTDIQATIKPIQSDTVLANLLD
jgi:hypothetical protein